MQTRAWPLSEMRTTFPLVVASLSAFCTVGCGGGGTTNVTPASASPSAMGGAGATTATGGAGSDAGAMPNPGAGPSPNPGADPSPNPGASGDFTWAVESSGSAAPLVAIWGAGAGDVWAAGGHRVLHSTGDGAWATVHEDADEEYEALVGADGWIFVGGLTCSGGVCSGGVILGSSDGGATWTKQTIGSGVVGLSAAAGSVYADSGDLYVSADHFATTTKVPLGWPTSRGVFADGGGALFAYGGLRGAEIRRTTDGAKTWTTVYSGFSGSKSGSIDALARAGTATMLALANGCSVPACMGAIFRSVDGGASWQQVAQPQDRVAGVWAASATELYVGGSALLRSVDAGATFTAIALPADRAIVALFGPGPAELYALAADGTILHGTR